MTEPRFRSRKLPSNTLSYTDMVKVGNDSPIISKESWRWDGREEIKDVNHSGFHKRKRSLADVGDDLYHLKVRGFLGATELEIGEFEHTPGVFRSFQGFATPDFNPNSVPEPSDYSSDRASMMELGATAIARCEPTNSLASGSTAIGELMKDGIPSIPIINSFKNRARIAANAGSEFLNTAFGWLPLKNDVESLARGVTHFDALMETYERQSGKPHRKQFEFPVERQSWEEVIDNSVCKIAFGDFSGYYPFNGDKGKLVVSHLMTKQRRFTGSFTYYLPTDYDSRRGTKVGAVASKKILGLELNPELLWNLAPWSWAADWVSNAGDVFHNVSAFADNGLVMHYGYITERTSHVVKYSHLGPTGRDGLSSVPASTFVKEVTHRVRADPYGFGVSWNGLSTFQQAVLVALGLSHRR